MKASSDNISAPDLIRKMKFFNLYDDGNSDLLVKAIHNEHGYRMIRTNLADQFDIVQNEPEIEIVDVDLSGDRQADPAAQNLQRAPDR